MFSDVAARPVTVVPDVPGTPHACGEIILELRRVHSESVAYWATYSTPEFFHRPAADVWSPADQVRHLTKSLRGIIVGFEMPTLLLILAFGVARRPSRGYQEFCAEYEATLRRGARAGRFAPRALDASEQTGEGRVALMQQHATAVERLCDALGKWSERALDRLRIRHPALGKLTAREMAMFALLHNVHHTHVAERRRTANV